MGAFDGLRRKVNADVNRGFGRAVKRMVLDVQADGAVPVDSTELQKGIEGTVIVLTGTTKKGKLISTTRNGGFDYPSYLNSRKRAYLNGNSNVHLAWWTRVATIDKWGNALRAELQNLG